MLKLPKKKKFIVYSSPFIVGIFFFIFAKPANAVCVQPIDPVTQKCSAGLTACNNDNTCCTDPIECSNRTATCSNDKPSERIPTCDVCGNVLFCSGNNYRACTDKDSGVFPDPTIGSEPRLGYINNPPDSVTFNNVTYPVPAGGLYFCDSNLNGCSNEACKQSGPTTSTTTQTAEVRTPKSAGFDPLEYPCDSTTDINPLGLGSIWDKLDFHPLRPYPGSPCDPLIPQSKPENKPITFACGKSLTAKAMESFDPYDPEFGCTKNGKDIVCTRKEDFDIQIDLTNAEIPILGNTQILSLTDAQKVNNYLTWYLMGSAQNWLEDKLFPLVPDDIERLVSYSGPLRKLLPMDTQQFDLRKTLLTDERGIEVNYHDYLIGCQGNIVTYWGRVWDRFVKLNPNASDDLITLIKKLINTFKNSTPVACQFFDTKYRLKEITPPPDPDKYKDWSDFWSAYIEWAKVVKVPILALGPLKIEVPIFLPWANVNAQIYQNIPFSTLEDVASEVTVSVFDDPRENKQDPDVITQDADKSFAGTSKARADADRLGLPYQSFNPEDTAYYKDQPHLVDLDIAEGDSRVYIPHLKSSRALVDLLQSLSIPHPESFDRSLVIGEQKEHQGINDDIPVVSENPNDKNNSSVRPGKAAPEALFGHTPSLPGLEYDALCDLTDVRYNPGDNIVGDKISANLRYTQIFRYEPKIPVGPVPDGGACSNDPDCKSGTCNEHPDGSKTCAVTPRVQLPTKGYAAIFTKTPFAEEIYQKLIAGKQSVLKRFLFKLDPYGIELKDIPGVSSVSYSANKGAEAVAGYGGRGAEIYWPRLGSIYDYILGSSVADHNLQKLLRPKELSGGIPLPGLPPGAGPLGSRCTTLGYDLPFRDTSIDPKSPDDLINALRTQNPGVFSQSVLNQAEANIRARYQEVVDRARIAGYNPAFVLAIWIEESAAGALGTSQFGCTRAPGDFDSQLDCFLGLYNFYSTNSLFSCREGVSSATFEDFMLFYSEGICTTIEAQNRQFCGNKQFPQRVSDFYSVVVGP